MTPKVCTTCGTSQAADLTNCVNCNSVLPEASTMAGAKVRPDGTVPMNIGIGLIILALALAVWSGMMSVTTYSFSTDIDPDKVAMKALLALGAGGAFGLGLILWLAGYVVHAISFLPGKEGAIAKN